MKNLKKVIFALMVVFLVVGFIGCKTETDPKDPPAPVNNFKGKTFLGMTGEGEDAYFASYIVFTSDKDCEVMFFDEEPMPATYTVADDVATLKGTGEYAALQLSTTKLTDGKFSITIPSAVSGEEEDIVVSYAVGTLWTILYDIPESDEDFSLKMPEEELDAAVEHFGFVEADYDKNDATKTVTLTASGWAKVQAAMGGGSEEEESGSSTGGNTETPETPETPVVTNNFKGKTFLGMTGEGEDAYFASYIVFTSDKDCEVMFFDEEPMPATYTVADDVATLKGTGEYAALQLSTTKLTDGKFSITIPSAVSGEEEDIVVSYAVGTLWTILYDIPESDEDFSLKMPEEELDAAVEHFGFVEADYDKNDATKTVTLTASGWAKVQAAMGGGSEEEGSEVTGETWTVLDPEGNEVMSFPSLEAAGAFATENGLDSDVDYTMDHENQTITLTADGWEKVSAGA